jgi:hypothetical protein
MNTQLKTAETLGMINQQQNIMRVASQSNELMNMLSNRKIGKTPNNESTTKQLMDAWYKGWDKAQNIEMNEKFGF